MTLKEDTQDLNSQTTIFQPTENTSTSKYVAVNGVASKCHSGPLARNAVVTKSQSSAILLYSRTHSAQLSEALCGSRTKSKSIL